MALRPKTPADFSADDNDDDDDHDDNDKCSPPRSIGIPWYFRRGGACELGEMCKELEPPKHSVHDLQKTNSLHLSEVQRLIPQPFFRGWQVCVLVL